MAPSPCWLDYVLLSLTHHFAASQVLPAADIQPTYMVQETGCDPGGRHILRVRPLPHARESYELRYVLSLRRKCECPLLPSHVQLTPMSTCLTPLV
jgi:hypothetical protein